MENKDHMANILHSPPYMPFDLEERTIWAVLVMMGFDPVQVKYDKVKRIVTVTTGKETDTQIVRELPISWAFRELEGMAMPLVKKAFAEMQEKKNNL